MSSMSADMSLLGSINYAFTRSCVPSTTVNGNTCNEQSSSDMLKSKTCQSVCDEPNCNANNDVEMLFSQTDSDDNLVYRRCFFYSSESDEQFNPTQPGVGDL